MQLNSPRWNLKYSIAASWAVSALTATGEGYKGSHLVIHQHFYTLSSAACLEGRCATFLKIQLDDSSQFSFILSVAEPSKAFFFRLKNHHFPSQELCCFISIMTCSFMCFIILLLIGISTIFLLLKWDSLVCNSQDQPYASFSQTDIIALFNLLIVTLLRRDNLLQHFSRRV